MAKKSSKPQQTQEHKCTFCGKPQEQVRRLIAAPHGAYICDECVKLCLEIIEEEFPQAPKRPVFSTEPGLYIDMLAKISETTGEVAQYSKNLPPEVLGHLTRAALVLTEHLTEIYESLLGQPLSEKDQAEINLLVKSSELHLQEKEETSSRDPDLDR